MEDSLLIVPTFSDYSRFSGSDFYPEFSESSGMYCHDEQEEESTISRDYDPTADFLLATPTSGYPSSPVSDFFNSDEALYLEGDLDSSPASPTSPSSSSSSSFPLKAEEICMDPTCGCSQSKGSETEGAKMVSPPCSTFASKACSPASSPPLSPKMEPLDEKDYPTAEPVRTCPGGDQCQCNSNSVSLSPAPTRSSTPFTRGSSSKPPVKRHSKRVIIKHEIPLPTPCVSDFSSSSNPCSPGSSTSLVTLPITPSTSVVMVVPSPPVSTLPPRKRKLGEVMPEEEKKERNKIAAQKYRYKLRVEAVGTEVRVTELEKENDALYLAIKREKDIIAKLRYTLLQHGFIVDEPDRGSA